MMKAGTVGERYVIERELGHGGMAIVYLAEDRKYGRQVAMKVLRPEFAESVGAERFLREIGIAARLSHPHIVPLIDSGEDDGLLYYVSPYVPGGSLRARLQQEGALPVRDAIRIAHEVGVALDFAHRAGIVHRDVKPENILFADGHALLADFGIARTWRPGQERITGSGLIVGTPEYMSPEQASGEDHLEAASDVYSLACVVYEMIAGEPPLKGDSPWSVIARHVTESPPPLRSRRPDAPEGVDKALRKALAKDPSHRHATVPSFLDALESNAASVIRAPTAAAHTIAVLPFVNASSDPETDYLSDGITDELIDALAKVEGLSLPSRSSVFALKGTRHDVRAIGALLGVAVVIEGSVRKSKERLRITAQLSSTDDGRLLWSHRYDRTLDDVFEVQDDIARAIVDRLRATTFADLSDLPMQRYTHNVKAYGLYLKGRYEWNKRSQEGVQAGIRYFEQAIAEDPAFAPAYSGLADSWANQVDYRSVPVHEGFARAKQYARQALALDETFAAAHASLAWSLFIYDWDWPAAEAEFRRAIALDPRYATAHQWYAFLLLVTGRSAEGLVEAHTAQELDPASVSIRRGLGSVYYYARRYDQARYHLERAVAMNPLAEESYRIQGLAFAMEGRFDEAERVLRESAALPTAGPYALAALGYVLARSGRRAEAEILLANLRARTRDGYVSPVAFAILHLGLEEWESALDFAEQAHRERRGWAVYMAVNPMLDAIRDHPRLAALTRSMTLRARSHA